MCKTNLKLLNCVSVATGNKNSIRTEYKNVDSAPKTLQFGKTKRLFDVRRLKSNAT